MVTKIQGVIRGWLERRRKVFKRYLKGLYAQRENERQRGIKNRVYRSMRLANSTEIAYAMQMLVKDHIYYTYRFAG